MMKLKQLGRYNLMLWALMIVSCTDWNDCVMSKTYFQSLGECKAEYNFQRPRLENIELVPYVACVPQENQNG